MREQGKEEMEKGVRLAPGPHFPRRFSPVKDVLMRIQPWMTAVAGTLMLLAAGTPTWGQAPLPGGSPGGPPGGPPGGYGGGYAVDPYCPPAGPGGAPMFHPPYGTNDPQALYPAGVPGEYRPWPEISPYHGANVSSDQHYYSHGNWFRKILYREREYYGSIEAIITWYPGAGRAIVGSPFAELAPWDRGLPRGVPVDVANVGTPEVPNFTPPVPGHFAVDTRVFPFPLLETGATGVEIDYRAYPIRRASDINAPLGQPGLQARWGYDNQDKTGFMMTGWWGFEGSNSFIRGHEFINGVPVTQALTLTLGGQNLSSLYGHVPLDNGEPFLSPDFGTGSTAKYDSYYEISHYTEAGGTNFSLYQQPLLDVGGVTIKPLWGLRYLHIGEGFAFRGIDSGFTYSVDLSDGDGTFRPDSPLDLLYPQFEARLSSDVRTHLAGPEIGMRFDLGRKSGRFKMWGESILGLNANYADMRLRGENIGDPLIDARFINPGDPRMFRPGVDTSFEERRSNVRVSPLFQQSVFADMDFLGTIPLIKEMSMFEGATFRFGYTFLWVGGVVRPADSIRWQGFPLTPEARPDYKHWTAHQMSFALDWRY